MARTFLCMANCFIRGAGARDEMNVLSWRTFSDVRVEICKDQTSRCALYMYSRLLPCLYLLYYDLESATGPWYRLYPNKLTCSHVLTYQPGLAL
jgi:hypothetical protein